MIDCLLFLLGAVCGIFCAAMAAAAGYMEDDRRHILKLKENEILSLLNDLVMISQALVDIMDREGSDYGHEDAQKRADAIVESYTRICDGEK